MSAPTGRSVCPAVMGDHILLDLKEWELILNKMLRYHFNISEEIKTVVQSIRTEMRPELIPLAEEKANYGKGESNQFGAGASET